MKKNPIIYEKESYKIIGIIYNVFNEVGYGHRENFYQKAIAIAFRKEEMQFHEQVYTVLKYDNEKIGKYYLDFLINDKIILEIKVGSNFSKKNIEQVYSYLKAHNLKLGIIANFTRNGIKIKRVVNID